MPVNLVSAGGGTTTLTPASSASSYTITLPAATGTAMVSGNMPAFSAYQSSGQAISTTTTTKISFQTENFDTNSNYDTSTYRFTPTVAGYYSVFMGGMILSTCAFQVMIYKNGSNVRLSSYFNASLSNPQSVATGLIYMNGSTDYLEGYCYASTGGTMNAGTIYTYFEACLVRSA